MAKATTRSRGKKKLQDVIESIPEEGDSVIATEGEEDDVKDFLAWSHNGPSTARVDAVDVRWRSYTGEYTDFRITR